MAKKKKTAPEAEGAEGTKKKSKKKKIMIVLLLVVVLGGGYEYMGMSKKAAAAGPGGPPTTVPGTLIEESSQTVNLRDGHYLEFTAALEVAKGGTATILATDSPVLLNILDSQCEAMTEPQLLVPAGEAKLKSNVMKALDQEWPGLITAVYFEQFVMQ
jgi:flagellar basal body-associated protein FliL